MDTTTERLRLEIEVAVKEALKNLAATSDEYKRLAKEAKSAIPPADQLKDTMTRLQADLKKNEMAARLFNDQLGGLKERQALLRGAMIDLIDKGIAPEAKELQDLKKEYDAAAIATKTLELQNEGLVGKLQSLVEAGAALQGARKITHFAAEAVAQFADAEAAATRLETALQLRGMQSALPELSAYADKLQEVAGYDADLVKQLEAELIAQGKTTAQTKATIEAAAGLSAVTGDDLSSSMQKLAATYSGIDGRMGQLIPELKNLTEEQLRNGAAVDLIREKYSAFVGQTGETSIAIERAKNNIGDLIEAFGEGLAPQIRVGADLIGGLAKALSSVSPQFKEIGGIITTVVLGALVGLTVRTAAVAAAKWGLFGAQMAVNSAMAVGNPLLWAGIAAAVAAVTATTALVVAKTQEANGIKQATDECTAYAAAQQVATNKAAAGAAQAKLTESAYRDMSLAMRDATQKSGNFAAAQAAVDTLRSLRAELATLERQATSTAKSFDSSLNTVKSILDSPVNPKSTDWWSGYKTETEKVHAAIEAINAISDKDIVNAIQRSKQYQEAVAKGSSAAIAEALKQINALDPKVQARIDAIKAEIKKIESGATITPVVAPPNSTTLSEDAKKWIDAWSKAYKEYNASISKNPYESLDVEKAEKLADAAEAGVNSKTSKKTIDEINAYYESKRRALAEKLAGEERAALAKLTDTKVDDLELEKATQLANLTELEDKAVAAAGLTQAEISAIHEKYVALRAGVETTYAEKIADTQKKEAEEAAASAFDLANKERSALAKITETKVDDLELERDRTLTLFTGTEAQKLEIARNYAKQIADAQIEEDKRVFAERLEAAKKGGQYGEYASLAVQDMTKETELGQVAGFAGGVSADPITMIIMALVSLATSIENVNAVLNPLTTLLEGAKPILEPLLNDALQPLVDLLKDIGLVIGQLLAPFINMFATNLRLLVGLLNIHVMPVLKLLGQAFAWFNDHVIVPVGNAIIDAINAVIRLINTIPGIELQLLDHLKTTEEATKAQEEINRQLELVADQIEAVRDVFNKKRSELQDAYSKNITSLKNLLELGAMSEAQYAQNVAQANASYEAALAALNAEEKNQLAELEAIRKRLEAGINVYQQSGTAPETPQVDSSGAAVGGLAGMAVGAAIAGPIGAVIGGLGGMIVGGIGDLFGWWDVGSTRIPEDQLSMVHKGEIIVPASFSEGLRRGDLTLSKAQTTRSVVYQTTVYVEGSIQTEDAIADNVAKRINRRLSRGQLEVS